jgi:hypothetical protein
MGIFNKNKVDPRADKENWLPEFKCADTMFLFSIYGLQNLETEIKQTCTDDKGHFDKDKYSYKWTLSFYELLAFWAYYLSTVGAKLIQEYNEKLLNSVIPLYVKESMEGIWEGYSEEFIKNKINDLYDFFNDRLHSYLECKELWDNEIDSATCIMHNIHRLGSMQLLCDYLFILIHEALNCPVSLDITFDMLVCGPIMDYIKSDELDKYVVDFKINTSKAPT